MRADQEKLIDCLNVGLLGIPAKTPGESRQTLVNIVVTVISLIMAMAAFFILYYRCTSLSSSS
jgi:hypothetical protein